MTRGENRKLRVDTNH